METIWDHNPTDEEMRKIWVADRAEVEEWTVDCDEKCHVHFLLELFEFRQDAARFEATLLRLSPYDAAIYRFNVCNDLF